MDRIDSDRLSGSAVWAARVERYLRDPDATSRRDELARRLGVDTWTLAALSVGWKPGAAGVGAWTYPQRSATGEIVSVGLRLDRDDDRQRYDSDGGKTKSPPGLIYIPGRFGTKTGPILIVEGMSDVAALDTVGLDVVGHAGVKPGGKLLEELEALLRRMPEDRPIVRIAERDPGREEDEESPGRKGARGTARALADRLGRRIGVALAPDAAKDSRDWLRSKCYAGVTLSPAVRDSLRDRFVEGTLAGVCWYDPEGREPQAEIPVEPIADTREEIELGEYRSAMRDAVQAWAQDRRSTGRFAVLAAPAGTGKTTAVDELAIGEYDSIVSGIPTHENCRERRESLVRLPILEESDVAAYPDLNAETCQSYTLEQATRLRADGHRHAVSAERFKLLGFGVRGTACRGCPLAPWKITGKTDTADEFLAPFDPNYVPPDEADDGLRCRYWREVERANAARAKVATLERLRRTMSTVLPADGRNLAIIDERGFETIVPTAIVDVHDLEKLADALNGAALRIQAETPAPGETRDSGSVCIGGRPHDFTTTREGKNYVDTCAACGHRKVWKDAPRRRASRSSAPVDSIFDTAEERADRRRWEQTKSKSANRRQEADDRREQRLADQVEHLSQLVAVSRELVDRLRAKAAAGVAGAEVVRIARESRRRLAKPGRDDIERAVDAAAERIKAEPDAGNKERRPEPLIVRGRAVKQPARLLADALERSLPPDAVIRSEALELVRRIHGGKVDALVLHADPIDGENSTRAPEDRRVRLSAIATWTTKIPASADVLVLDGSLDVDGLSKRLGVDIAQIAPKARVRRQSPAVQFPADICQRTADSTVGRTLEQALAAMPEAKRVGIILLQEHRRTLFPRDRDGNDIRTKRSRELVPDHVLRRIARDADGRLLVEHYGGGKDRSSNQWIALADGLVLLGTPRPAPVAVVGELVRRMELDAVQRGSDWGRKDWEARTQDGKLVRCRGRGYLDPAWTAAAAAVVRASLLQALERARTALAVGEGVDGRPGGIPVLVVSGEGGLGLPVLESLPDSVSRGARRVEEIVRGMVEKAPGVSPAEPVGEDPGNLGGPGDPTDGSSACDTIPTRRHTLLVGRMSQAGIGTDPAGSEPVARARDVLEEILRTGLDGKTATSERHARRWIAEAVAHGLITKTGATSRTVYGLPWPVSDIRDETPVVSGVELELQAWELVDWAVSAFEDAEDPLDVFAATGPRDGPIGYRDRWLADLPTGPAAA